MTLGIILSVLFWVIILFLAYHRNEEEKKKAEKLKKSIKVFIELKDELEKILCFDIQISNPIEPFDQTATIYLSCVNVSVSLKNDSKFYLEKKALINYQSFAKVKSKYPNYFNGERLSKKAIDDIMIYLLQHTQLRKMQPYDASKYSYIFYLSENEMTEEKAAKTHGSIKSRINTIGELYDELLLSENDYQIKRFISACQSHDWIPRRYWNWELE
jgi:hypothetical protein